MTDTSKLRDRLQRLAPGPKGDLRLPKDLRDELLSLLRDWGQVRPGQVRALWSDKKRQWVQVQVLEVQAGQATIRTPKGEVRRGIWAGVLDDPARLAEQQCSDETQRADWWRRVAEQRDARVQVLTDMLVACQEWIEDDNGYCHGEDGETIGIWYDDPEYLLEEIQGVLIPSGGNGCHPSAPDAPPPVVDLVLSDLERDRRNDPCCGEYPIPLSGEDR